jgi:hypothetical protein
VFPSIIAPSPPSLLFSHHPHPPALHSSCPIPPVSSIPSAHTARPPGIPPQPSHGTPDDGPKFSLRSVPFIPTSPSVLRKMVEIASHLPNGVSGGASNEPPQRQKVNGEVKGHRRTGSYAKRHNIPAHFIGGNHLLAAPPGKVTDYVANHDGHTVITSVGGKIGHALPPTPLFPPKQEGPLLKTLRIRF